jgi:hypothetical protein
LLPFLKFFTFFRGNEERWPHCVIPRRSNERKVVDNFVRVRNISNPLAICSRGVRILAAISRQIPQRGMATYATAHICQGGGQQPPTLSQRGLITRIKAENLAELSGHLLEIRPSTRKVATFLQSL